MRNWKITKIVVKACLLILVLMSGSNFSVLMLMICNFKHFKQFL
jgi:ABC-type multidrug transport system permease subunit